MEHPVYPRWGFKRINPNMFEAAMLTRCWEQPDLQSVEQITLRIKDIVTEACNVAVPKVGIP